MGICGFGTGLTAISYFLSSATLLHGERRGALSNEREPYPLWAVFFNGEYPRDQVRGNICVQDEKPYTGDFAFPDETPIRVVKLVPMTPEQESWLEDRWETVDLIMQLKTALQARDSSFWDRLAIAAADDFRAKHGPGIGMANDGVEPSG
jgi:hypothetical protein